MVAKQQQNYQPDKALKPSAHVTKYEKPYRLFGWQWHIQCRQDKYPYKVPIDSIVTLYVSLAIFLSQIYWSCWGLFAILSAGLVAKYMPKVS